MKFAANENHVTVVTISLAEKEKLIVLKAIKKFSTLTSAFSLFYKNTKHVYEIFPPLDSFSTQLRHLILSMPKRNKF